VVPRGTLWFGLSWTLVYSVTLSTYRRRTYRWPSYRTPNGPFDLGGRPGQPCSGAVITQIFRIHYNVCLCVLYTTTIAADDVTHSLFKLITLACWASFLIYYFFHSIAAALTRISSFSLSQASCLYNNR